jgi:Flp pilus assembly protein TadD
VYLARKDIEKAVSTLQKAAQLQPKQAEAWLALGQAYAQQGNKAEAGKALNQCVQLSQPGPLHDQCKKVLQQVGTP